MEFHDLGIFQEYCLLYFLTIPFVSLPLLKDLSRPQQESMAVFQTQELSVQRVALPLHVQKLQRAFKLGPLIGQVEKVFRDGLSSNGEAT